MQEAANVVMRSAAGCIVAMLLFGCECEQRDAAADDAPRRTPPVPSDTPLGACVAEAGDVDARYMPVVRALCAEKVSLRIPGVALAIAERGRTRFSVALGVRCSGRRGRVDDSTPFRIGSLTKMFTAAAAVALDEAGTISLEAPIATFVPELRELSGPVSARAFHRFLDHTAGLQDVTPTASSAGLDIEGLVRIWVAGATEESDTTFRYANTGYYFAGLALERATHESVQSLVTRLVLQPHDIDASFDAEAIRDRAACGHLSTDDGPTAIDVVADFDRYAHGAVWALPAGGLITSAPDLVRFALGPGSGELSRRAITTAGPTEDPDDGYALGVHVRALDDGRTVLFHRGSTGDFSAELHWIPRADFAVAVLGNAGAPLRATVHAALSLVDAEPPAR